MRHRSRAYRRWFAVLLIIALLATYASLVSLPIMYRGTELFYEKDFSTHGVLSGTGGLVGASGTETIIGGINFNESSYADFTLQFFPDLIGKAQNPYLKIRGTVTINPPEFQINQTFWIVDDFSDLAGWSMRDINNASISLSNGDSVLTMTASMTSEKDQYVLWRELPSIPASDGSQYLVAKFRSSDRVAFFSVWENGECISYATAQRSGDKWLTTVLKVPENRHVVRIAIGIFDEGYPQISGTQMVDFDWIAIASGKLTGISILRLTLNNQIVFHDELQGDLHQDLLTLQVAQSFLKVNNHLRILVDRNTIWNVSSVSLGFAIRNSSSSPPLWRFITPYIYTAFICEIAVLILILRRFAK